MEAPITSEINLETGLVLKEIATGQLFVIRERQKHGLEVSGEDIWNITPVDRTAINQSPRALTRNEISERYFAEIDE